MSRYLIEVELNKKDIMALMDWHLDKPSSDELKKRVMGQLFNSFVNCFYKYEEV